MFYRQIENEIFSKILDHSGGGFSSGHRWGILGGRQGYGENRQCGGGATAVGSQECFLFVTVFPNNQR
jgi:hypothetical protein